VWSNTHNNRIENAGRFMPTWFLSKPFTPAPPKNSGCHEGNTKGGMSCCTWNRGKVNASLVLRPRASDRCPQPYAAARLAAPVPMLYATLQTGLGTNYTLS
jgi:hypothetical protein